MPEVDPRFDPQFQRGYDPAKHGRSRGAAPRTPRATVAPRDPSTPRDPGTPPSHPSPVANGASDPAAETPVRDGGTSPESRPEEEFDPPHRNPFRLILLLASIACVAGAALLFWRRLDADPYGGEYQSDVWSVFTYQFVDALMVPLLTGGLIGFCLWLALGALRGSRDSRAPRRRDEA